MNEDVVDFGDSAIIDVSDDQNSVTTKEARTQEEGHRGTDEQDRTMSRVTKHDQEGRIGTTERKEEYVAQGRPKEVRSQTVEDLRQMKKGGNPE